MMWKGRGPQEALSSWGMWGPVTHPLGFHLNHSRPRIGEGERKQRAPVRPSAVPPPASLSGVRAVGVRSIRGVHVCVCMCVTSSEHRDRGSDGRSLQEETQQVALENKLAVSYGNIISLEATSCFKNNTYKFFAFPVLRAFQPCWLACASQLPACDSLTHCRIPRPHAVVGEGGHMAVSSRMPWDGLSSFQLSYRRPLQASTPWPQATSLTLGKLEPGPLPGFGPGRCHHGSWWAMSVRSERRVCSGIWGVVGVPRLGKAVPLTVTSL